MVKTFGLIPLSRSFRAELFTLALLISNISIVLSSAVHEIYNVKRSPPPLPSGWTSLGCYTDSTSLRTLSALSYAGSNVSVETCTALCSAYAYAGMEYSDECYCGNTLLGGSTAVNSTQCTMLCAGNSGEVCGGPDRLTLLQQSSVAAIAPPSTVAVYNSWVSLGCYSDSVSARTLSAGAAVIGQVTVESCCNACQAAGYPLAGVEYSDQCFCGTSFLNGGGPVSSGCIMGCAGNSSELCGGPNRLNVYNNTAVVLTTPTVGPWQYIGCYSDNIYARTLVNAVSVNGAMTVEGCVAACQAANFSFAGLEYRQQCYCGNSFVNGGGPVSSGCDMTCIGNPSETCGGANRLSVYNNTAVPDNTGVSAPPTVVPEYNGWVSLGCYSDNIVNGVHSINVAVGIPGLFTVENCVDFCSAHGFILAGVENGNQCYCSSEVGPGSLPVTQGCNLPCQGNTTELCGGTSTFNLYIMGYLPTPPTTLASYGTWNSIGCYGWTPGSAGWFGFGFNGLTTVEKCVSLCQARNYPFAAVSNGGCYCSNGLPGTTPSSVGCILPCNGNHGEFCGNEYYFNGYQNTAFNQFSNSPAITVPGYGHWVSLGCYSTGGSALPDNLTDDIGGLMTVEKCVSICAAGLTIAAVGSGNTCTCGDSIPSGFAPVASGCSTPCAGNSSEFCGGTNTLNVYNYTLPFV